MTPTIKLDDTRGKLGEGRSSGIGFALLKKIGEGSFQGVQPISPCKDYLNDVVYSEQTGKPFRAHGLFTKKEGIFDTNAYLAFASCQCKYGGGYSEFDNEVKLLETNLTNTQKVINDIERMLNIKDLTELLPAASNLVFAKISTDWVSSTWAMSLWSFIIRNAIYSTGGDAFEELKKTKIGGDVYSVKEVIEKIKVFAEKGLPKQDWDNMNGVHSNGILSYSL